MPSLAKFGPRTSAQRSCRSLFRSVQSFLWFLLAVLVCNAPVNAQTPPAEDHGARSPLADAPAPKVPDADNQASASLAGVVIDPKGNPVVGAKISLTRPNQMTVSAVTGDDGRFAFANLAPGPLELAINAEGFAAVSATVVLRAGEASELPTFTLALATTVTEVRVGIPPFELAQEQVHEEEQQRVFGFLPNFYVTYNANAVPLSTGQKFHLAWKTTIDPVSFGLTAASAGIEQATDEYGGYGQGAEGYGKRYGASYGDFVIGTYIGSAILPSILHQDPRYFYKGTGSKRSRVMYAIANAVICKGDNGHWQPNYSGIGGSIAAGGISNLYYPNGERGASLVFENTLIGIGTSAAANILQEFVIRKLTPNLPNHAQASP